MSPTQVYKCPEHGEFEVSVPLGVDVDKVLRCTVWVPHGVPSVEEEQCYYLCDEESPWVPSIPNFIGGPTTGAGNK